jgi:hypothetical protein
MPVKKATSARPTKSNKRPVTKKKTAAHWWNTPNGRPLLILIVIAVVGVGAFAISKLSGGAGFTRTYSYSNGSAGFSFEYPSDFTDNTKPAVLGGTNDGSFVTQQSRRDPDGAIIGFVRAMYNPEAENTSLLESLRDALGGGQAALRAFNEQIGSSTYGDCSDASLIHAANNRSLVKCSLSSLVGSSYKGDVLFGASNAGVYEFDYWIQTKYWNEHAGAWDSVFTNISYK